VRWLVSFDEFPTRKDEEIPEEAIGPVVEHFEITPKINSDSTSSNGDTSTVVTPCMVDNVAAVMKSDKTTTRNLRRKSTPGSNSSSTADDRATSIKHRVSKTNSDAPSTVMLEKANLPKEKLVSSSQIAQEGNSMSPSITTRERRSLRRQASSHNEISEPTMASSSIRTTAPPFTNGGLSLLNKRSIVQKNIIKAKGDNNSRNKKAKIGVSNDSSVRGKSEVLEVRLLTGTLYLYRGAQRHVEFIPKY
jgi:hypothetical protein